MVVPSSDLTRVVEQVVARFVQRYSAPPRYDHAEWRAECLGEAWGCVADARRTFDPTRGCFIGYVARAVWQHLLDFRAREQRWARRACVSLDAPAQTADGEACEGAWLDPASVEVEAEVVARVAWEQALAGLSMADRQLVEWVWLAGISQAEAAGRLGVSQPAVAKRLARLRAALRGKLGENWEQGGYNSGGCSE